MRVVLGIVASFAEMTDDGKFTVVQGGFETLYLPHFPVIASYPLYYALKILYSAEEAGRESFIRIEYRNQVDELLAPYEQRLQIPPSTPPSVTSRANLVVAFTSIIYAAPGEYAIKVIVDGNEIHNQTLSVRRQI
jgi:hypothetical protein